MNAPVPEAVRADWTASTRLSEQQVAAMRAYRLQRVQQTLREQDCDAILLSNPVNIRYATDSRNMTVWSLHNQARYCIVPAEGKAVLFDYANRNCLNATTPLPAVGERRLARIHAFFDVGEHALAVSRLWAEEVADVIRSLTGGTAGRIAVDRCDLLGYRALEAAGLRLVEGQRIMELARSIKSAEEVACARIALAVADLGIRRMRERLEPGITENALWSELHRTNIECDGEWIETRLLCSGPRTNPWFQECSDRVIGAGDLVSFDTDLIGPYGYCADLSRTLYCGTGKPTDRQRMLHALAAEQVAHNCELLAPGRSFREFLEKSWPIPARYLEQNYGCTLHGVGLVDEWPLVLAESGDPFEQDGVLQPGMTVCIESYIGEPGGPEGVKLEQQVLVTETGHEILSTTPLEPLLL